MLLCHYPKIAALRKRAGLSQEQLSEALGAHAAVSKWESGGAMPELDKIVQRRRVLGVPPTRSQTN
ncbi:MAG: helix-turn-helix domain-containing protein [Ruthenibacterium lactatiformans]